jgi:putative hydrolase of the HAD superfamily
MLPWHEIDHVLLDMDGTLLDLHFDNHFWLEYVPRSYAQRHGMSLEAAKAVLFPKFRAAEGTMAWYCVDHWSRELDLDIAGLKGEIRHLIAVHEHVIGFLDAVRQADKRVVLVTNAHAKSLALKMECTCLESHFDALVCAHDLGYPKEDPRFWPELEKREPFSRERTLFVDDSLPVLRSAAGFGIRHLLAIRRPDSRGPLREVDEFPSVENFAGLWPGKP